MTSGNLNKEQKVNFFSRVVYRVFLSSLIVSIAYPAHLAFAQSDLKQKRLIQPDSPISTQAKTMSLEDRNEITDQTRKMALDLLGDIGQDTKTFKNRERTQPVDLTQPRETLEKGSETFTNFDLENQGGDERVTLGLWTRITSVNENDFSVAYRICNEKFDCNENEKGGPIASTLIRVSFDSSPNDNLRNISRRFRNLGRKATEYVEEVTKETEESKPVLQKVLESVTSLLFPQSALAQSISLSDDRKIGKDLAAAIKSKKSDPKRNKGQEFFADLFWSSLSFIAFSTLMVAIPVGGLMSMKTPFPQAVAGFIVFGGLYCLALSVLVFYGLRQRHS